MPKTAVVSEGTPPPVKVSSWVWNASTLKWVETVSDQARTEAQWPALIVLPDGNVYNADATGVFLTDEQAQQISPTSTTYVTVS